MEHAKTDQSKAQQSDTQISISEQEQTSAPVGIFKKLLIPTPRNVLQLQRLIGNRGVGRLIQRTPTDEAPAAAPQSADQAAAFAGIKDALIAGKFAYKGFYKADTAGKFREFRDEALEQALKHYVHWADNVSSEPVMTPWEQKMERSRIAQAAKLAAQRKQQAETRARMRENRESGAVKTLRTNIDSAKKRKATQIVGIPNDPEAYRRMLAEGLDSDPTKRDSAKLDLYKGQQSEIDLNAAIYQSLRGQKRDIIAKRSAREQRQLDLSALIEAARTEEAKARQDYQPVAAAYRKANPKGGKTPPNLIALERVLKAATSKFKGLLSEETSYPSEMNEMLFEEFEVRMTIIKIADQLDQPYRALGIEGRYTNQDPRTIADPKEREKKTKEDPFLSVGLDVPGRFVKSKEIEEDKKWVEEQLAAEHAKLKAAAAKVQEAQSQGDTSAPAAVPVAVPDAEEGAPTSLQGIKDNLEKEDKTELYQKLKAETEMATNHQQLLVAGDTAGHNIVEHPQWFLKIMTKLMGLTPADPIKKVINPGPVWDAEADGAQALLTAYLNAWTKRRMAIVNKTNGVDEEGRKELIPTNIEVMNAAVGYSETNERAELFSGLRGEMDWCGPGTQRSVILGLWKAGMYLRTGKPPLTLQNLSSIPQIATQIRALDLEIATLVKDQADKKVIFLKKQQRRALFWKVWGDWLRKDLTLQDSSMIADWFKEGPKKAPAKSAAPAAGTPQGTAPGADQTDQRRQVDLPEAATAPLCPGDFVYWVSSFPYGPIAGHVATIMEEKDRVKNPSASQTDSRVSTLHIDSANAGGVRQGEGSVRPEQIERVVTDAGFDYWSAAGDSNAYYYGQKPEVSRDGYNALYNATQERMNKKAKETGTEAEKPGDDPAVKAMGERIKKYKAGTTFPVHKLPQTPADYLEPSNRYQQELSRIGPRKQDSVWIVSIKRTGKLLDPLKMLGTDGNQADKGYSAMKAGTDTLDLSKLGERRVAVMPPGMKEAIVEIMSLGGFGRLLQGETFDEKFQAFDHLDKSDQKAVIGKKPDDIYE